MTNYENRIVLFLDILGFKKIIDATVEKGQDQSDKIEKLYETLRVIGEEVSKINKGTSKVITQFSDSIVVSFEENDTSEFSAFFQSILSLTIKLISHDIICRGAISYGKLIHTEDVVFGPALNDAYLTESTAALYPRIILDKSVVDTLKANYNTRVSDLLSKMRMESKVMSTLNIDTDDKLYIDYFTGALTLIHDESILEYFSILRKFVSGGHRYTTPNVKIKFGWMKNKFNKFLNELPSIQDEHNLNYDYLNKLAKVERLK
jgi:hypothetical protein